MAPMLSRTLLVTAAVAGVTLMALAFPPFHLVPLDKARESRGEARFNAAEFADRFWQEQLLPALPRAADARAVLDALDRDFQAARQKYGRTVGVSSTFHLFLQGTGRIVKVDSKGMVLSLRDGNAEPEVLLPLGMIFGNTVRDATGLLDMNAFPNSQDFNALSTELNRIVEERVQPKLREQAKVGSEIHFIGCASISAAAKRRMPLKVIPLHVDFLNSG